MVEAYQADSSWRAKIRRRTVRLAARRPAAAPPGPMVSFVFDDAPATAVDTGAAILERHGLRGSFYIAAALAGTDAAVGRMAEPEAVRRLAETGHEIGCHTFSHLDCGQAAPCDAVEDVARNTEALSAWGVGRPATFAYPFGDVAPATKRALAGRFALLRALHPGLIGAGADLNQAPAVPVEGPGGEALGLAWLRRAVQRQAWVILCTHDVADDPSPWGCTPATLERLVTAALELGLEAVTVAEGARRVGRGTQTP
jgi:peptidoglycan/xylan/chitin deacetylase (PgdA/CDA1 family)